MKEKNKSGGNFLAVIEPGFELCVFSGLMQPFAVHFHAHYLAGFLLAGKRTLKLKGRRRTLSPGDALFLNPFELHGCVSEDDRPLSWLGFNIAPEWLRKFCDREFGCASFPRFSGDVANLQEEKEILSRICKLQEEFCARQRCGWRRIAAHEACVAGRKPENPGSSQAHLMRGIKPLLRLLLQKEIAAFKSEPAPAAPQCPDTRFARPVFPEKPLFALNGLTPLYTAKGLGKHQFNRRFKKECGFAPWRYIEALKIDEACKLLVKGDKISEIASACGFADQSHFTRAFKSRYGFSPGLYRDLLGHPLADGASGAEE